MPDILLATTDGEIAECFAVMHVLRPHLIEGEFIVRIRQQQAEGYRLSYIRDGLSVVAAAGYRIGHFLAWGKILYIDDLVTLPAKRGSGHGKALLTYITAYARDNQCDELHLDSGYTRLDAHRLYLNHGMNLAAHHFSMKLK